MHARGVATPNLLIGVLIFFSGICQFIRFVPLLSLIPFHPFPSSSLSLPPLHPPAHPSVHSGIASLITGDTLSGTIFPSYAAFNFAYALIYLPGSGILSAYTDPTTSVSSTPHLTPEFAQALAVWIWAWFILTCIFLVGAMRTNWVVVTTLAVLAVDLACQASGLMVGEENLVLAGNGLGFVVCFLACE